MKFETNALMRVFLFIQNLDWSRILKLVKLRNIHCNDIHKFYFDIIGSTSKHLKLKITLNTIWAGNANLPPSSFFVIASTLLTNFDSNMGFKSLIFERHFESKSSKIVFFLNRRNKVFCDIKTDIVEV